MAKFNRDFMRALDASGSGAASGWRTRRTPSEAAKTEEVENWRIRDVRPFVSLIGNKPAKARSRTGNLTRGVVALGGE